MRVAWRNLIKYPSYSLVNLCGLALGISASFVLLLYAIQELSYDRHFADGDRIYRIAADFYNMGGFAKSQEGLLDHLPSECPSIAQYTRFDKGTALELTVDDQPYVERDFLYVDSLFFQMFPYTFVEGEAGEVMTTPHEIILSERLARKYFGKESALGKYVEIGEDGLSYRVSGVVQSTTKKTHLKSDLWLPVYNRHEKNPHWTNVTYYNYVKLHPSAGAHDLEIALEELRRKKVHPSIAPNSSFEEWSQSDFAVKFFVQPLHDIYLHSDFAMMETIPGGNPTQIYILGIIGIFIILIAGSNYINLTTARSSLRGKEVGIRKTLGAERRMLVKQMLTESILFSLLAAVIAAGLVEILLLAFKKISGTAILSTLLSGWQYIGLLLLYSLLSGVFAGIYPAFYLTAFRPARTIKGNFTAKGNKRLRGGLVSLQFCIAIALIVSSLIVYQQLRYLQTKDTGFEMEGVVVVDNVVDLGGQEEAFRQKLRTQPQLQLSSFAQRLPAGNSMWMSSYRTPEMSETVTIQTFPVDADYIPVMGMRLESGRNFDRQLATDSNSVIINEMAAKKLGLTQPIGSVLNGNLKVVGLVRDFNFQSFRDQIAPAVLTMGKEMGRLLILKLHGTDISSFLTYMNETWLEFSSEEPIQYHFLEENFATLVQNERTLSQAIGFFTLLALIIACLGLYGLASFTAEQRTREIGIRKILGSSTFGIVSLLSRDFLKLVLIALVVAAPIAYVLMNQWLQGFAFRIQISWWTFALAGLAAMAIAFLTVGYQSLKVALTNPADSLRNE